MHASQRAGSLLVTMLNAATILLASAISVSSQAQRVFAPFDAGLQQAFAYAEPETARRISFRLKRPRTPGASFTRSRPCSGPQC
jgi:hypothetical protein